MNESEVEVKVNAVAELLSCTKLCWDVNMNNKCFPVTSKVVDRNNIMLADQESSTVSLSFEIARFDSITTNTWTTGTTVEKVLSEKYIK